MSKVGKFNPVEKVPSKRELIVFTKFLRDPVCSRGLHAICSQAKSMHPEAANRQSNINVVDLYITFACSLKSLLRFDEQHGQSLAAVKLQFLVCLSSLLDQDTYAWQFLSFA